jgi:signal transduction histidine kinase
MKNIQIEINYLNFDEKNSEEEFNFYNDRNRVKLVITNLLENALKFSFQDNNL